MDKKKRAALAAVVEYLQTETCYEMVAAEQPAAVVAIPDRTRLPIASPWGLTGRSAQMQTRNLMQLRAFRS